VSGLEAIDQPTVTVGMAVKSAIRSMVTRTLAAAMESRLRYRFFGPDAILAGAEIRPGQIVLEVGCGTGFFTLPAARMVGERGRLVAMDVFPESVERVSEKVRRSALLNIRVIECDALRAGLEDEAVDTVLLFGVIPAPMVPLGRLLPEMHRILKEEGALAVWPSIPGWLPSSVLRSGLFTLSSYRNGVHNFKRVSSIEASMKKTH
jgi:ubiquinone/menaquinone biosynthesis C-methylase UbiE